MNFTYKDYQALIGLLRENGYAFSSYVNYPGKGKCVILRHDIDYSLEQAVKLARIEKDLGVRSTYFVLLTCDFYNVFSSGCQKVFYYKEIPEYEVKGDSMFLDSCNSMLSSNIVVWNKIFDKSLITKNNIKFPYKVSEDIFFCWEFFSHMDKMLFLTDYFGVKRYMYSESYSHSADVNNVINTIRSTRELDEKLVNEYIDFNKYPKFRFSFSASSIEFILMRISFLTETESIRLCLNELYEYEKEILFDNSLNNKLYKFINFFILKNKLSFATFIFNLMNFVKNSKVLSTIIKKLIAIK